MDVLQHQNLNEQPFSISPNPRFLYLSEQLKEAIAKCEYMTMNRIGPLYIYGPIGSGKTTLLRTIRQRFAEDERYVVSTIISANLKTSNAYLRTIMDEFDVKTERSYDLSLHNFNRFLIDQYKAGKIPLLLVDEAQNMVRDTLRLIHYLLNFETDTEKLLQIVLVGQEELATKILRYQELASRMFPIAINAMSREDLERMIEFRWMVAGGGHVPLDRDGYDRLFAYSRGLPRDAIRMCDEALRYLVARGGSLIDVGMLEEVAAGLNLGGRDVNLR